MTQETQSTYNTKSINSLRDEASDVKECFTRFSFQGLIFCTALLGVIATLMEKEPLFGWLCVLGIIVLMAISKIGIHKYKASNRNYGFQIFASRFNASKKRMPKNIGTEFEKIDHEELMYAWRVIYGTITKNIFHRYFFRFRKKYRLKKKYKKSAAWIRVNSLLYEKNERDRKWTSRWSRWRDKSDKVRVYYDPGSYVRAMQQMFIYIILAFMATLLLMNYLIWAPAEGIVVTEFFSLNAIKAYSFPILNAVATMAFILSTFTFVKKHIVEREVLEKGINSISTSAIMWGAVVIAHIRCVNFVRNHLPCSGSPIFESYNADNEQEKNEDRKMKLFFDSALYNKLLAEEALDLVDKIGDLEGWITKRIDKLGNRFYRRTKVDKKIQVKVRLFREGKGEVDNLSASIFDISLSGIQLKAHDKFNGDEYNYATIEIPSFKQGKISVDVVQHEPEVIRMKFDKLISQDELTMICQAA